MKLPHLTLSQSINNQRNMALLIFMAVSMVKCSVLMNFIVITAQLKKHLIDYSSVIFHD